MVHRPGSAPPGVMSVKVSRLPSPLAYKQTPRRTYGAPPGDAARHKPCVNPMIVSNNRRNNGSSDLPFRRGILPPPSPELPNGCGTGSHLTAALLARAAHKLSSSTPGARRKRTGSRIPVTMSSSKESSNDNCQLLFPNSSSYPDPASHLASNFHEILRTSPPRTPPALLRNLGHKETSASGRVKVMLRVIRGAEDQGEGASHLEVDGRRKQVTLYDPAQGPSEESRGVGVAAPKMFAFDAVFGPEDPQLDICSGSLNEVLQSVVNGNDACLFSYGYSNLGKTRTMIGGREDGVGVIPAAISWLYRLISEQKQRSGARFSVRVSALHITGKAESLNDLLVDYANGTESSGTSPGVYLREDPLFGAQLQNQSELRAPSPEKAAYYLDAALTAKRTCEELDAVSHFLFTLHVYQYRIDKSGHSGVAGGRSRLHLLDLGGCDRQMQVFAQSKSFRLSLAGLGNVILAIFNGQKHVPYKETKLTRLLRDVLGNVTCRCAMIAHVSTCPSRYTETLATVQLASRIHRLRHKKCRSGEDGGHQRGCRRPDGTPRSSSSELCTSSSEQSCDTVIFLGSGGGAGLQGHEEAKGRPSFANVCKMAVVPSLPTIPADGPWTNTRDILLPRRHPQPTAKVIPSEVSRIPVKMRQHPLSEQWVDGPHGNPEPQKPRLQGLEMWVDGPIADARFIDCGKRAMVQQWIEVQTRLLEVTVCKPALEEREKDLEESAVKDCWMQVSEEEIMAECVALGDLGSLERLPMALEREEVQDSDDSVDGDHPLRVLSEESLPASFTTVATECASSRKAFRRTTSRSLQDLNAETLKGVTRSLSETSLAVKDQVEDDGLLRELRKPDGASDSNLDRHPSATEVKMTGAPWFKMVKGADPWVMPDNTMAILDRFKCDAVSMEDLPSSAECPYETWAWPNGPSNKIALVSPQRKDRRTTSNAFCCVSARTGTGSGSLRSSSCASSLEFMTAKDYEAAKANMAAVNEGAAAAKNKPGFSRNKEPQTSTAKCEMSGQQAEGQFCGGSSGYESMALGDTGSSFSHPESTNESCTEETLKANVDTANITNEEGSDARRCVGGDKADNFRIDVYCNEDLERFERQNSDEIIALRRRRSRYFKLKQKQTELKRELALAKERLMIDESRWSYDLFVEDSMDQSDSSFLEALENETWTLEKRVAACRSRVWLETSFDAIPIKE